MVKLYVRFHEEAKDDPALDDEGRAWFKKIEDGDAEALAHLQLVQGSHPARTPSSVYDLLGVTVRFLRRRELLQRQDAAGHRRTEGKGPAQGGSRARMIVDLERLRHAARRSFCAPTARRCISRATWPPPSTARIPTTSTSRLYVVAYQQDLHFRQLFKVLELMGYDWAKDCEHVAFGMVSYEGQTLVHPRGPRGLSWRTCSHQAIREGARHHRGKEPRPARTRTRSPGRSAWARWCSSRCTTTASRTSTSGGIAR